MSDCFDNVLDTFVPLVQINIRYGKKEGTIKNGQSRDTGKLKLQSRMDNPGIRGQIGHETHNEDKQNQNHNRENCQISAIRAPPFGRLVLLQDGNSKLQGWWNFPF